MKTAPAVQLMAFLAGASLLFPIMAASPDKALAQQPMASEFLAYENAEAGVSIEHPSDWMLFERGPSDDPTFVAAFVPPQAEFVDFAIHVEDVPEDVTLQQYTEIGNQTIRDAFPDTEITLSDDMTLSGNPAHVVTYSATVDGTSSSITQVWTVAGSKAYVVTYRASADEYQAFTAVADRMIGSFQITQTSSAASEPAPAAAGNASDVESARQQFLSVWQQTPFNASFSTFIESFSDQGYGIYAEHGSDVFAPDDTVVLYLEPVGFSHKPVLDEQGEQLYQINLTASVQLMQNNATTPTPEAAPVNQTISDIPPIVIVSHRQNTELFMTIPIYLYQSDPPFPEGDYAITYAITDGESGQSFTIEKDIRIARTVSSTG